MAKRSEKVKKVKVRKATTKKANIPVKQGKPKSPKKKKAESNVGYKNPPKEHQFPPGQSGNPNGPPKRRTQLWVWFCKFMDMTDAEIKKLDTKELTQAQQSALKLVKNMKNGKDSGSERLARHCFDREEGKAVEHLIIGTEDVLSDDECEDIREELLKNHAD